MTAPDLRQRVLESVARKPSPTRSETLRARGWLLSAGVLGAVAIFFLKGGVRLTNRPPTLVALTSLGTSMIAGLGMYVLFTRPGRSMLRRRAFWYVTAGGLAVIAFVGWRYGISAVFGLVQPWPTRVGFRCLALSLAMGALPLFAALVVWRNSDPLSPVSTGAAFGTGAGLGSAVLVDLWCPVAYVPHLLLGHVLPIVVLAIVGGGLGSRVLRLRRR